MSEGLGHVLIAPLRKQRYYLLVEYFEDGEWWFRFQEGPPDELREYVPKENERVRLLRRFE